VRSRGNEIAWQLAELLAMPSGTGRTAATIAGDLVGRAVSEEEVLAWLTLGAAARQRQPPCCDRWLHAFVRGISGAVVTFPTGERGPKLWLAAEDELHESEEGERHAHFPVTTCTTCGQHYFVYLSQGLRVHRASVRAAAKPSARLVLGTARRGAGRTASSAARSHHRRQRRR
jgi:hypothetical protein